ncbi:MAG: DUF1329 domain-containing protein [Burkholderiales bacterium]
MTSKSTPALRTLVGATIAAAALLGASAAHAEATAQEIARLGKDLTPVGAEMAANADGSIPAFTGGLTTVQALDSKKGYTNPYAADKPLFTITAANAAQYEKFLAPGQLALLKQYPDYKFKVYPTHRSVGMPDWVAKNVLRDAPNAKLADGGFGTANVPTSGTFPFPFPKNGAEVIQNHNLRYRGIAPHGVVAILATQANGSFVPIKWMYDATFTGKMPDADPNRVFYFTQVTLSPSNSAGEATMVIDAVDQSKEKRQAWTYNPGQRRVLRAPDVAYDTPFFNVDGTATVDDSDMFSGAVDRYDWKLVGKKEMIISYNNYDLAAKTVKYADLIHGNHFNQELPRYEKHRVWVVEATLKAGARHIYAKRVFYVDEDTWQIAHTDKYDARGGLWRVGECHQILNLAPGGGSWTAGNVSHDLQARRVFAEYLTQEEKPMVFDQPRPRSNYTSDAFRRLGN